MEVGAASLKVPYFRLELDEEEIVSVVSGRIDEQVGP